MPIEIRMLAWSILLGLVQLLLAAAMATSQRGVRWNVGPRDGVTAPLAGVAGRLERASNNFRETFAFFAAAVLAVVLLHQGSATSALGAQLYFWARVAYVPVYALGIPYLRGLVWAVSIGGLVMVASALPGG